MDTEKKKFIDESQEELITLNEENFGGDHDNGSEEDHMSLDPADVEVD